MNKPAGVILAGGRSSRMGVTRKALIELNGQPLLTHVTGRLADHLDPLLLSCESETSDFDRFGLAIIPDLLPGYRGPLTGLYSALQYLDDEGHNDGLVLCPCDAPFIPGNLVQVLLDADQSEPGKVIAISCQGVLQPTFSLWQNHHLPAIREAVVERGVGGLKHLLTSLPHKVVEWAPTESPGEPPPFFNVNTPEELESAALWLDRMHT
jgi:molybdopterin-guanine dinucleotide biosynthesis protein A